MTSYNPAAIQKLLDSHDYPIHTVVETGTHKAKSTRKMSAMFRNVYTIEITKEFWVAVAPLLDGIDNVTSLHADSAEAVPELCEKLQEPVLWYLDAHWYPFGGKIMSRDNPFPLWVELDAIAARNQPDVVMVDDVHAFGRENWGANPPPGVVENWKGLTREAIVDRLGRVKSSQITMDKVVCFLTAQNSVRAN